MTKREKKLIMYGVQKKKISQIEKLLILTQKINQNKAFKISAHALRETFVNDNPTLKNMPSILYATNYKNAVNADKNAIALIKIGKIFAVSDEQAQKLNSAKISSNFYASLATTLKIFIALESLKQIKK